MISRILEPVHLALALILHGSTKQALILRGRINRALLNIVVICEHYFARHMCARTNPRVKIRVHFGEHVVRQQCWFDNRVCEAVRAYASSVERHHMTGSACQAHAGFVRSCDFLRNAA